MKLEEISQEIKEKQEMIDTIDKDRDELLKNKMLLKNLNVVKSVIYFGILAGSVIITFSSMSINSFTNIWPNIFACFIMPNIIGYTASNIVPNIISKNKTNMSFSELKEYVENKEIECNGKIEIRQRLSLDIMKLEVMESAIRFKENSNDNLISKEIDNREYKWSSYVIGKDDNNDYYCKPVTRKRVPNDDLDNKNN